MLPSVKSDIERAHLISKVIKLLCDLKSMPFFNDLVTSVQPVLVSNIDKCNEPQAKDHLRTAIEHLLTHMNDSESKTLLTQTLNKLNNDK